MNASDPGGFVLKSALRTAIVMPLAFALSLQVVGDEQMALFAAFGSMALLVFVDFGGSSRARLRAYLLLLLCGAALIALGTLCSHSTALAAVAMAVVGFAILFAGVLDDYAAAAYAAAILTFVLSVMVSADAATIPMRLAGWGLAGALCIPATLLLWPGRPRNAIRHGAAQAAGALAELVEAGSGGDRARIDDAAQAARAAIAGVRDRFVAMTQRPSGTIGPTAALARLIDDLGWLTRIAVRSREPAPAPAEATTTTTTTTTTTIPPCPDERVETEAAVPAALRAVAARLDGAPAHATRELERLEQAYESFSRAQLEHFRRMRADRDEAEAARELDDAYRLRQLSYGTLQAGRDALWACHDHARGADAPPAGDTSPAGNASPAGDPLPAGNAALSVQMLHARLRAGSRVLRTHASPNSVWLRNSLRGAAGLALAVLVGKLTDLQDGFWIVLGTMSVLRSNALTTSATIARALLGTLAGIVAGGLIVIAVGADRGVLWAVLPLAALLAAYAPQAISFAAGQAAFTLVVLVLFNLLQPDGWRVGIVRIEDVAVGAGVSLLVGVLLWPRGTRTILREAIGAAYIRSAQQLDTTIALLLGEGDSARADRAAREASDAGQLLDTALRDYLASRPTAPGRLHDLTVLSTGAGRMRRVAGLLADSHELWRLAPLAQTPPRLARARAAFDSERSACCGWYESLGKAISQAAPPPAPAGSRPGAGDGELEAQRTAPSRVVLEGASAHDQVQPGLAIAWAQRHLDVLAEMEPVLTAACRRIAQLDDASQTACYAVRHADRHTSRDAQSER
ncbi:MAG TPA: FUSC family protein [Solirubrobacteraceae bacterium]